MGHRVVHEADLVGQEQEVGSGSDQAMDEFDMEERAERFLPISVLRGRGREGRRDQYRAEIESPNSAHLLEVTEPVIEPTWVAIITCRFPLSEGECIMEGERKSKRIDECKRKAIDGNSAGPAPTLQAALRRANEENAALKVKVKNLEDKVILLEDDKQFLRQSLSEGE
ncbi:hypothetical protein SRHO_G00098520 [Serrasalmus rhombeus]